MGHISKQPIIDVNEIIMIGLGYCRSLFDWAPETLAIF